MSLDPHLLGWTEFWLRIAALGLVAAATLLTLLVVAKLLTTALEGFLWVRRHMRRRG